MISVQEAEALILGNIKNVSEDARSFHSLAIAQLRVSLNQEPIIADRNYPSFNRSAMDGIALASEVYNSGQRSFKIEDCQKAGEPQKKLTSPQHCIEIMTGAPVPTGCDLVIRYENINIETESNQDQIAKIQTDLRIIPFMNIHREGTDYKKDDLLIPRHSLMLSPQWGVAASVGKSILQITAQPKIAVISTGDELVRVNEEPKAHQLRMSNSYAILSSLRTNGFEYATIKHLKDDPKEIHNELEKLLATHDFIILSGGVSMGKFDCVPKVLGELKVKEVFHKVRQRPGKPLWFGLSEEGKAVFGLPGNPVATLVCFQRYVLPALFKYMGNEKNVNVQPYAILEEQIEFSPPLTYFLSVKIRFGSDGKIYAKPVRSNGSGDFASLARSDGFVQLSEGQTLFQAGAAFPLFSWKGLI